MKRGKRGCCNNYATHAMLTLRFICVALFDYTSRLLLREPWQQGVVVSEG